MRTLILIILLAAPTLAADAPRNPDQFPSLTLTMSYSSLNNYIDDGIDTETLSKFDRLMPAMSVLYPIHNRATLLGRFEYGDTNVGGFERLVTYDITVGVKIYFNRD